MIAVAIITLMERGSVTDHFSEMQNAIMAVITTVAAIGRNLRMKR